MISCLLSVYLLSACYSLDNIVWSFQIWHFAKTADKTTRFGVKIRRMVRQKQYEGRLTIFTNKTSS